MNELKPCPFCGGKAMISRRTLDDRTRYDHWFIVVRCASCYASAAPQTADVIDTEDGQPILDPDAELRAVQAWNRRVTEECG